MKPRVLRFKKVQTYFLPSAAAEVWEPVWHGHRLISRLDLLLESVADVELTPVRCLILAHIGRASGLGVGAARLARELSLPRATLGYHLEILKRAQLISAWPSGVHDRRRRPLVLTERGALVLNQAAALLVELTCKGDWPAGAPRRNHWNLRRIPSDSPIFGFIGGDPYPGVSMRKPPPARP